MIPLLRARPSLHGYARSQIESANPLLWQGLRGAWVPALGAQSDSGSIIDISGYGNHGLPGISSDPVWTETGVLPDPMSTLQFSGTNNNFISVGNAYSFSVNDQYTFISVMTVSETATDDRTIVAKWGNANQRQLVVRIDQATAPADVEVYTSAGILQMNSASVVELDTPYLFSLRNNGTGSAGGFALDIYSVPDGVRLDSVAGTHGADESDLSFAVTLWGRSGNDPHQGLGLASYLYDELMTSDRIQLLARDFLAPFRLKQNRFYFDSVAASASKNKLAIHLGGDIYMFLS